MTEVRSAQPVSAPAGIRGFDITAKAGLMMLLALALAFPDIGHMRDKAAGLRAIAYPLLSFTVPVVWAIWWRDRAPFPWLADLLVTLTCFTDILGNRMNLYDTIVWFDDWMHYMNTGFLAAAIILLTLHRHTSLPAIVERALAFGVTAAVGWEIAEYFAFISTSSERQGAYTDTLADLGLGTLGTLTAALLIHHLWRHNHLNSTEPLPPTPTLSPAAAS